MRATVFVTVLALALSAGAQSSDAGVAGVRLSKVFKGPEGEQLAIVFLEPVSAKRALVRVTGTTSEADGKVWDVAVEESSERADYRATTGRKSSYVVVAMRGGQYEFSLPGLRDGVNVKYDEKLSKEFDPHPVISGLKSNPAVPAAPPKK